MGASSWHYFVPHDSDVRRALAELRAQVFARSDFGLGSGLRGRGKRRRSSAAATIAEPLARAGTEGTHSILDVERIVDEPLPLPFWAWLIMERRTGREPSEAECTARQLAELQAGQGFHGIVAPLAEQQCLALFESQRPTRAAVEAGLAGMLVCHRGTAVYFSVYDESGEPHELCFVGMSGD